MIYLTVNNIPYVTCTYFVLLPVNKPNKSTVDMYIWLSNCSTIKGSRSLVAQGSPAKLGAILFTESSHAVEIKNTWLILLPHSDRICSFSS